MRMPVRRLILLASCLGAAASADRNIIVDGSNADWVGVSTCFSGFTGTGGGIVLSRSCVENNNTAGTNGFMFFEFESNSDFPTNQDVWFGYLIDLNNDGKIDDNDEAYATHYAPGPGGVSDRLDVFTAVTFRLKRSYTNVADCGGSGTNNGWSGVKSTRVAEMKMSYACIPGLSYGNDYRLMQAGVYPNFYTTVTSYYDGTNDSLSAIGAPPDVTVPTALATNARNTVYWTNPSQHRGVLILRAPNAAPNTAPTAGTAYSVNQTLGNATVVYFDDNGSTATSFSDTNVTNGTKYFYKLYNHHETYTYSTGNVPGPSGLFATPTNRVSPNPLWCYSTGFDARIQPVTDPGNGIFSAGNIGAITSNSTTPSNLATDGSERFRPTALGGPIQQRFLNLAIPGKTGVYIVTGDQSGRAYAINDSTGAVAWTANGGVVLGDRIQAQPIMQINSLSNAAFQAAHPNVDLYFVATRNNSATNNTVYALNSSDGTVAWTYSPGDLDIVNGGMLADYAHNYLWIASRSNSNTQASLRVISTVDGTEVKSGGAPVKLKLGDIDTGLARAYVKAPNDQVMVVTTAGIAYGFDMITFQQIWSVNTGATSSYLFTIGSNQATGGFLASVKATGIVQYLLNGATVTKGWTVPITNPSGIRFDYATQKFYVGSTDGKLHQIDYATGTEDTTKAINFGSGVGMPTIDPTSSVHRLHVGLADGRLCAIQLPIP